MSNSLPALSIATGVVQQLYVLAHEIADAVAADAAKPVADAGSGGAASVVCRAHAEVANILRGCFAPEKGLAPPWGTSAATPSQPPPSPTLTFIRTTSDACEGRLIALWNAVCGPTRWDSYRATLPRETSPFQDAFSATERQGTYHRLVEGGLLPLMLRRCDAIARTAQAKGANEAVQRWVHARVRPHKHALQKRLVASLKAACGCFESAMRAAQTPACVQCGRKSACPGGASGDSSLHECAGCHAVWYCGVECETLYRSTDAGRIHYTNGNCQLMSSWHKTGWSGAGLAQMTELVLLHAEMWEALGGVVGSKRTEVLERFTEVQAAWERVYTTGPAGTLEEKKRRGVAVGVTRDTKSDSDAFSPMMQACDRGLGVLVREVLNARDAVVGPL